MPIMASKTASVLRPSLSVERCFPLLATELPYNVLLASSKYFYGPQRLAGIQPVDHFAPMNKLCSLA